PSSPRSRWLGPVRPFLCSKRWLPRDGGPFGSNGSATSSGPGGWRFPSRWAGSRRGHSSPSSPTVDTRGPSAVDAKGHGGPNVGIERAMVEGHELRDDEVD